MVLNHEPKYPSRRAYVLRLAGDATPQALAGRIENLVTGVQRVFGSGDELLAAIARDVEAGTTASPIRSDGQRIDDTQLGRSGTRPVDRAGRTPSNGKTRPTMNMNLDDFSVGRSALSLEELDRELARLALLCRIRILDPGIVERVLHNDRSVCGTNNAIAFRKLRDLLMMHFALRTELANSIGQARTAAIEANVIERLKKVFPDQGDPSPPK